MTEYDYSPEAYERHIHKMQGVGKWVNNTNSQPPANPFTAKTEVPQMPPLPYDERSRQLAGGRGMPVQMPQRPRTAPPRGDVYGQQYSPNSSFPPPMPLVPYPPLVMLPPPFPLPPLVIVEQSHRHTHHHHKSHRKRSHHSNSAASSTATLIPARPTPTRSYTHQPVPNSYPVPQAIMPNSSPTPAFQNIPTQTYLLSPSTVLFPFFDDRNHSYLSCP